MMKQKRGYVWDLDMNYQFTWKTLYSKYNYLIAVLRSWSFLYPFIILWRRYIKTILQEAII